MKELARDMSHRDGAHSLPTVRGGGGRGVHSGWYGLGGHVLSEHHVPENGGG